MCRIPLHQSFEASPGSSSILVLSNVRRHNYLILEGLFGLDRLFLDRNNLRRRIRQSMLTSSGKIWDTLMTLRLATKAWKRVADAFIDEGVRSEELIVHGGKDKSWSWGDPRWKDLKERHKLVTWVVFFHNIPKIAL